MRRIILVGAVMASLQVYAADWQNVATDKGSRVDIDRASLLPSDPGKKVVWMRLVMSPEDAGREGYHTLKALNRYDCRANSYATIKRVYLREDMTVMREERVEGERDSAVQNGTTDAKLFREVCQQPAAGDIRKVALQAAEAGQKAAKAVDKEAKKDARSEDKAEEKKADEKKADKKDAAKDDGKHHADTKADGEAKKEAEAKNDGEAKKPLVDIRPSLHRADLKAEAEASKADGGPAKKDAVAAKKDVAPAAKPERHAALKPAAPAAPAAAPTHATSARAKEAAERRAILADMERSRPVAPRVQVAHLATPAAAAHGDKPVTAASPAADTHTGVAHQVHWSYEGETGPDNWGALKPEWKTCGIGDRQSPIDIRDGIRVDQEPVRFYYKPSGFSVIDNGHTVQVNVTAGNRIQVMGRDFELVQFHFHRPSEERVNGKLYDMVAHLVHKDKDGRLAVVAVLLDKGSTNATIQTLWNSMPLERNVEVPVPVALDLEAFLPEDRKYFSYMGSLTTPPCTEGVLWIVMRNPVSVAADQVAAFSRLYPNNARPIQQVAGRLIKESR